MTAPALAWNHNAYYHRLLLRQLPAPADRVLEVGCGAGDLAVKLARVVGRVDALDISGPMIELARQAAPGNVHCTLGDVLTMDLPAGAYDAIVSLSALHHLPLDEVLPRLARALRPGGVLAAVALPRRDLPLELPVELAAGAGHRLYGAAFAGLRAAGRGDWYAMPPSHGIMPVVLGAPLTTRQVRRQTAAILPGAQVRRLVFWRYLLRWRKPAAAREAAW